MLVGVQNNNFNHSTFHRFALPVDFCQLQKANFKMHRVSDKVRNTFGSGEKKHHHENRAFEDKNYMVNLSTSLHLLV